MIEGVDKDPRGDEDPQPNESVKPCARAAWCFLDHDHDGPCAERVRAPIAAGDYGPKHKRTEPKR